MSYVNHHRNQYPRQLSFIRTYLDQHKVAIVCSARSGSTKERGTTTLLLRAASEALKRPTKNGGTPGTTTPVTRGMFGQMGCDSPPDSPRPRTRSSPRSPSPATMSSLNLSTIQSNKTLPEFYATVDIIRTEHIEAARASIQNQDILHELEEEIEKDCEWLRSFLFAAQVSDATFFASLDSHMSVGHR